MIERSGRCWFKDVNPRKMFPAILARYVALRQHSAPVLLCRLENLHCHYQLAGKGRDSAGFCRFCDMLTGVGALWQIVHSICDCYAEGLTNQTSVSYVKEGRWNVISSFGRLDQIAYRERSRFWGQDSKYGWCFYSVAWRQKCS